MINLILLATACMALYCFYRVWLELPIGTKSLICGAHCFFLHPIAVLRGWWFLYGWPNSVPICASFALHDVGYWSLPNMDGPEGQLHPEFGARVMLWLFDWSLDDAFHWHDFALYHSRSYAKLNGAKPSRLCHADKMAFCFQFKTLYLAGIKLTGEIEEYMANAAGYNKRLGYTAIRCDTASNWYDDMCGYMARVGINGAS